ncbi:flavin reductase [Planosporangium thailandense]|uniref:Flavin reductase n=1 Tax=Planosporangium thailandense TaxID=765197 RepID=A0ABX0XSF3_9ACTN|nr:flavin reductase family protein [Planosporangium thailandense]NJC68942.1 flavin reductase [Planosporangium thailandense]
MTISPSDPFATPDHLRSPVRRLRGRLPAAVTLWTAPGPAGLTVSSTLVVDGEPGHLLGILDEESEVWAAIEDAGRFAVTALTAEDRQLADRFAGLMPAPGGLFAGGGWRETGYGPVPAERSTWAGCRLTSARPVGWGLLVEATIEAVELGDPEPPLVHYRGRYRELS